MLFRYLTAVPFEDHGSPIESLECTGRSQGTFSARVVPKAKLTRLDVALLKDVYRLIPCEFGLPEAVLNFDDRFNAISYSGIPTPEKCVAILGGDQNARERWVNRRIQHKAEVVYAVQALDSSLGIGSKSGIVLKVAELIAVIKSMAPVLFTTALFDEYAFAQAVVLAEDCSVESIKQEIFSKVLTSPCSQRFTDIPAWLRNQKRLIVPSTARYLPSLGDLVVAATPSDFTLRTKHALQADDIDKLDFIHFIFECSEELSLLWGSIVSNLSCALTVIFDEVDAESVLGCTNPEAFYYSKARSK